MTVKNTSTSSINGWTVKWTYNNGEGFDGSPWNGVLTTQAPNVTVKNASYNGQLAPNASTAFGFNATGSVPATAPTLTCTSP
ncbi:cellulose binding domain-containing protein [Nonomuraea rubra]|uniref:cellulose binding domain-containing protein n=1 Tax=Nonomuraea rubra TaxID=46180 RepID=UPI00361BDE33